MNGHFDLLLVSTILIGWYRVFLFYISLLAIKSDSFLYPDTGIYKHLFFSQVAVSNTGEVYCLDKVEGSVLHFLPNGTRNPDIGGLGQGPGKLNRPVSIKIFENKLYVFEYRKIHEFSLDGKYLKTVRKPDSVLYFNPVIGGWLGLSGVYPRQAKMPTQLIFFDSDLRESVIYTWPSENSRDNNKTESVDISVVIAGEDRTTMVVNDRGDRCAVHPCGTNEVYLFDLSKPDLKKIIKIADPPVPFDPEDAKEMEKIFNSDPSAPHVRVVVPEHYPPIQTFLFSLKNQLIIWKGHREKAAAEEKTILFDDTGQRLTPEPADLIRFRLVKIIDGMAYLIVFTEEETWSVLRIPVKDVFDYARSNSLPPVDINSF